MLMQTIGFGHPVHVERSQLCLLTKCRTEGVCADALILCPDGWRPLRDIAVGDNISIRNNGSAKVTGITLQKTTTDVDTHFAEIGAGVLGANSPVLVAPDHCIFMRHFLASAFFGALEIVVPAHLISNDGSIGRSHRRTASLCLIECTQQEIVCINGVWMGTALGERTPARPRIDESQSPLIVQTEAFFRAPVACK